MSDKVKRRRNQLFRLQKGKCHWCSCTMIHWDDVPDDVKQRRMPLNMATLDHLYDRFHPERRKPNRNSEQRWVIACWECNNKRSRASQAAQSLENLWKKSGKGAWSELND